MFLFTYIPRYNFSLSRIQLRKAAITSNNGLNIETYKGPFLSIHQELKYNASEEHTVPYNKNQIFSRKLNKRTQTNILERNLNILTL